MASYQVGSSSNSSLSPSGFEKFLAETSTVKLADLIPLLEEKLFEVIEQERLVPSYQRARLSSGGIKEEGVLRQVSKISPKTVSELQADTSRPKSDDVEAMIEYLGRCARIEALANQQKNLRVKIETALKAEEFQLFSKTATFFPYNGEGMTDYGWGCCWRATQTSLSAMVGEEGRLKKVPTFEDLFHLFGSNAVLKRIYIDFLIVRKQMSEDAAMAQADSLFSRSQFSPYQHPYGWSNPFVSQLMFHYYGLDSAMVTVNGMPTSLKQRELPDELLDANFDFCALKELLLAHFSVEKPLPVVIDDGKFAMAIVGVKAEKDQTTLWFADPHIKGGANRPETPVIYDDDCPEASFTHRPDPMAGLYSLTFDSLGRQMASSVEDHAVMFSRKSYEETEFYTKPWMFTFPQR